MDTPMRKNGGRMPAPVQGTEGEKPLASLVDALSALMEATEEDFLALGSRLSEFQGQSREVARQGQATAEVLLGEAGSGTLRELQSLIRRLQQHREELTRTLAGEQQGLGEIARLLEGLQEPLGALRKVAKLLQGLRIATCIEICSQERKDGGIFSLPEEIRALAELIGNRFGHMREELDGLEHDCRRAWEKLVRMQADQHDQAEIFLQQAAAALETLVNRTREATREAGDLSLQAAGFSEEIGEMVVSVQFQDIVRQKIEHIRHALANLNEGNGKGVGEVCLLQAAHLQLAREEMERAGERIVDSLRSLATRTSTLTARTARAAGLDGSEGTPVLRKMEEVIASGARLLQAQAMVRQESSQAIGAVAAAVDAMAALLKEIDLLSEKMKLVALNTAISAVRAAREQASLGVIAQSIEQLSRQTLTLARELAGGFRRIMAIAAGLGEEQAEERPATLAGDAAMLLDRLQGINGDLKRGLEKMGAAADHLTQGLYRNAEHLVFHRNFCRQAGDIQEKLKRLAELQGGGAPADREGIFHDLFARYTMHSEREIHLAQRPEAGARNVIHLEERRTARRGSEIGDNVELF